ncbi:adenosine deaminase-like protein [Lactarius vividus]|nr:adenosine deaminase-like protein [Lactarius vividus]
MITSALSSPSMTPADDALRLLSPAQLAFLDRLPKAELHAHLNGSIPLPLLQELAQEYLSAPTTATANADTHPTPIVAADVISGLQLLQAGVILDRIDNFFGLFPAIYALTSTPAALRRATRGVLSHFLDGASGAVAYIELRTTPRETPGVMTRREYLEAVLDEVEARAPDAAALIVSLDRRMERAVAQEVLVLAVQLRREGRRVVGVDLCGDPKAGNMEDFVGLFRTARAEGLGVTLHIAETRENSVAETVKLLSCEPHRLGHATFLDDQAKELVLARRTCIEICLTSNILCKTVERLEDHHIRYYLERNHPIAVCTDDILPFRNSVLAEYALLMAPKPVGLGLSESEIETVARMGMQSRFPNPIPWAPIGTHALAPRELWRE